MPFAFAVNAAYTQFCEFPDVERQRSASPSSPSTYSCCANVASGSLSLANAVESARCDVSETVFNPLSSTFASVVPSSPSAVNFSSSVFSSGRFFLNDLISYPAICSQSDALPPFPQRSNFLSERYTERKSANAESTFCFSPTSTGYRSKSSSYIFFVLSFMLIFSLRNRKRGYIAYIFVQFCRHDLTNLRAQSKAFAIDRF